MRARQLSWKGLTCTLDFGLYVVRLSLRLRANRIATYGADTGGINRGNRTVPLNRDQVLLVVLALADGVPLTPVKVQKALFLADERVRDAFANRYNFQPYDYGPFDRRVYGDADRMRDEGLVEIGSDPRGGWNTYAATAEGLQRGRDLGELLNADQLTTLSKIVHLVRSLSFTELVSAIYRAYPEMRARSVFRD